MGVHRCRRDVQGSGDQLLGFGAEPVQQHLLLPRRQDGPFIAPVVGDGAGHRRAEVGGVGRRGVDGGHQVQPALRLGQETGRPQIQAGQDRRGVRAHRVDDHPVPCRRESSDHIRIRSTLPELQIGNDDVDTGKRCRVDLIGVGERSGQLDRWCRRPAPGLDTGMHDVVVVNDGHPDRLGLEVGVAAHVRVLLTVVAGARHTGSQDVWVQVMCSAVVVVVVVSMRGSPAPDPAARR